MALGTVLPGAGLLRTRWRVLGAVMSVGAVVVGIYVAVRIWRSGLLRSALDLAVQPALLQRLAVIVMVGAVLWVGSIVLTAH
ncbi:MAG: LytR family transcriptional regulator, partial [Ornithinibacter sp.]